MGKMRPGPWPELQAPVLFHPVPPSLPKAGLRRGGGGARAAVPRFGRVAARGPEAAPSFPVCSECFLCCLLLRRNDGIPGLLPPV